MGKVTDPSKAELTTSSQNAQRICYQLFAFYGQRAQITVNLSADSKPWVYDSTQDSLIYLLTSIKVSRAEHGVYLPIWCGPLFFVQTKLS